MKKQTEVKDSKESKQVSKPKSRPKGRNRSRRFESEDYKTDSKRSGANDISWYAQDATLLRNVGNLPWSTQTGITYKHTYTWENADHTTGSGSQQTTVPGIFVAYALTGIGRTKADIDAVNVSANAIYTYVRHMNSGAKNYDAPDLMSYLLAMDDVFCYINWLQRLYGTIAAYNVFNRYTPKALIEMQGVDYEDLRDNIVQFRYRINLAIKQAATLVVPNNMPIFFRHSWMFQNYYIEGNDIKDQIYMYSPLMFRMLDPTTGNLNAVAWDADPSTIYTQLDGGLSTDPAFSGKFLGYKTLCDVLDEMLKVLYTNEDTGIMAGDILKAYGAANVLRLSELPDAYITPILPNNEVLLQMKNSNSPVGLDDALNSPGFNNITCDPDTNEISWNLDCNFGSTVSGIYPSVSQWEPITLEGDPSIEMNMIMTRCKSYADLEQESDNTSTIHYYSGTELIARYRICSDPQIDFLPGMGVFTFGSYFFSTNASNIASIASVLSNFKYHPCVTCIGTQNWKTATNLLTPHRLFQMDNFTFVESDILDRLHQVAIMSELNVPHMALIK